MNRPPNIGNQRVLVVDDNPAIHQDFQKILGPGLDGEAALASSEAALFLEFRNKGFLEGIRAVLHETQLEPRYLELEITEGILMQDVESTISVLQTLKDMGVRLAIDDFGTGYSSLSYLRRFPVDALKIDQSFVRDIGTDVNAATLVSAIVSMGRSLKLRVIAEGVETQEQLAFLQAHQCEEGQGFYFSRAVAADAFATLLAGAMAERVQTSGSRTCR